MQANIYSIQPVLLHATTTKLTYIICFSLTIGVAFIVELQFESVCKGNTMQYMQLQAS